MAELIYSQTVTGFTLKADSETVYEAAISSGAPAITSGEVYTVVWNGKKYICAAEEGELGNKPLNISGLHTHEPFLYVDNGDGTGKIFTTDNAESHTISIYKGIDNPDGYLVYDRTIPFVDNDTFYSGTFYEAAPVLVVDNTYTVIWDGKYFVCKAEAAEIEGMASIVIGNKSLVSIGDDTEEPFLYEFVSDYGIGGINTLSTEAEHVISVYDGVLEDEGGTEDGKVIFVEQTFNFTAVDGSSTDSYRTYLETGTLSLTAGKKYTVVWDGVSYTAFAYGYGQGGVILGNHSIFGPENEDTGEPFFLGRVTFNAGSSDAHTEDFIDTLSTASSHTVGISEAYDQNGYLVENQTLAFTLGEGTDTYNWVSPFSHYKAFVLIDAETYTVVWDGVQYVETARKISQDGMEGILIGNGKFYDMADGGQPFSSVYVPAYSVNSFITNETDESHTISIYKGDLTDSGDDTTTDGYLLKDQTLAFELETNSETVYYNNEVAPAITTGNTYTVIWDGNYHECVAKEYAAEGLTFITLGNLSIQDSTAEDTGEPFLYMYYMGNTANFKTLETDASHVVSLYDGVLEQPVPETVNLVLLDRNGNPVTYEGIKTVSFNTADGKIATFTLSAISS